MLKVCERFVQFENVMMIKLTEFLVRGDGVVLVCEVVGSLSAGLECRCWSDDIISGFSFLLWSSDDFDQFPSGTSSSLDWSDIASEPGSIDQISVKKNKI